MKKRKRKQKKGKSTKKYLLQQRKKALLGIIDVLILQWIKKTPMSGQDIMNKILKEFDIKFSPGTIYPILFGLKNKRIITSTTIDKNKLYHLTLKGKTLQKSLGIDYLKIQKKLKSFF